MTPNPWLAANAPRRASNDNRDRPLLDRAVPLLLTVAAATVACLATLETTVRAITS